MPSQTKYPIPRASRRLALALCIAFVGCAENGPLGPAFPPVDPEVEAFALLVNEHRVYQGCEPLTWSPQVAAVAQAHSADMVARGFFAHTNPDGLSPFDRMSAAGVSYRGAAENIAYGFGTAESVLEAWLDSPGHRANIENCSLTEHGVGLEGTHWTHLFRRP